MRTKITIFLLFYFTNIFSQDLKEFANNVLIKYDIPEISFAVVTKDSILVKNTLGHHQFDQINDNQNATLNDLFHLGSNTKAITSFIAAYLVENGKINWNTKFFDLFPNLKLKSNSKYYNITLEELLIHRGRIQPFTSGLEYKQLPKFMGDKNKQRNQFSQYVLTLPAIENDEDYNYSNAGYSIATMMLEKVSKKSWEKLIDEVLVKRLNINVAFGWPNRNFENQPYGHWIENGKLVPILPNIDYNLNLAEPAGDLSMDIENYSKFIQLNIDGLSGNDNFLKSNTYKYLHTSKKHYALGWGNFENINNQISEHSGSDGTFFAYTQIDRKNLIGYIVFVNSGTENAQKGVFEMIKEMKNKIHR